MKISGSLERISDKGTDTDEFDFLLANAAKEELFDESNFKAMTIM